MSFLNEIRYELVKRLPLKRQPVVFSHKDDWEKDICHSINLYRYWPIFAEFTDIDIRNFELVIPLTIRDINLLNLHYPDLNCHTFLIPDPETVRLCNDKVLFNSFLSANGYGHLLPELGAELSLPYILKKRIDGWGENSFVIKTPEQEEEFRAQILSGDYFKQAYISGSSEYTTHILFHNHRVLFHGSLEFRFKEEFFIKGKYFRANSTLKISETPGLNDMIRILHDMSYEGICCFNYKIRQGKIALFEINPRYGSSLTAYLPELMVAYEQALIF